MSLLSDPGSGRPITIPLLAGVEIRTRSGKVPKEVTKALGELTRLPFEIEKYIRGAEQAAAEYRQRQAAREQANRINTAIATSTPVPMPPIATSTPVPTAGVLTPDQLLARQQVLSPPLGPTIPVPVPVPTPQAVPTATPTPEVPTATPTPAVPTTPLTVRQQQAYQQTHPLQVLRFAAEAKGIPEEAASPYFQLLHRELLARGAPADIPLADLMNLPPEEYATALRERTSRPPAPIPPEYPASLEELNLPPAIRTEATDFLGKLDKSFPLALASAATKPPVGNLPYVTPQETIALATQISQQPQIKDYSVAYAELKAFTGLDDETAAATALAMQQEGVPPSLGPEFFFKKMIDQVGWEGLTPGLRDAFRARAAFLKRRPDDFETAKEMFLPKGEKPLIPPYVFEGPPTGFEAAKTGALTAIYNIGNLAKAATEKLGPLEKPAQALLLSGLPGGLPAVATERVLSKFGVPSPVEGLRDLIEAELATGGTPAEQEQLGFGVQDFGLQEQFRQQLFTEPTTAAIYGATEQVGDFTEFLFRKAGAPEGVAKKAGLAAEFAAPIAATALTALATGGLSAVAAGSTSAAVRTAAGTGARSLAALNKGLIGLYMVTDPVAFTQLEEGYRSGQLSDEQFALYSGLIAAGWAPVLAGAARGKTARPGELPATRETVRLTTADLKEAAPEADWIAKRVMEEVDPETAMVAADPGKPAQLRVRMAEKLQEVQKPLVKLSQDLEVAAKKIEAKIAGAEKKRVRGSAAKKHLAYWESLTENRGFISEYATEVFPTRNAAEEAAALQLDIDLAGPDRASVIAGLISSTDLMGNLTPEQRAYLLRRYYEIMAFEPAFREVYGPQVTKARTDIPNEVRRNHLKRALADAEARIKRAAEKAEAKAEGEETPPEIPAWAEVAATIYKREKPSGLRALVRRINTYRKQKQLLEKIEAREARKQARQAARAQAIAAGTTEASPAEAAATTAETTAAGTAEAATASATAAETAAAGTTAAVPAAAGEAAGVTAAGAATGKKAAGAAEAVAASPAGKKAPPSNPYLASFDELERAYDPKEPYAAALLTHDLSKRRIPAPDESAAKMLDAVLERSGNDYRSLSNTLSLRPEAERQQAATTVNFIWRRARESQALDVARAVKNKPKDALPRPAVDVYDRIIQGTNDPELARKIVGELLELERDISYTFRDRPAVAENLRNTIHNYVKGRKEDLQWLATAREFIAKRAKRPFETAPDWYLIPIDKTPVVEPITDVPRAEPARLTKEEIDTAGKEHCP